jgi:hypothetical protein
MRELGDGEVLETGHGGDAPRWSRTATIVVAAVLAGLAVGAAVSAWITRDPTSGELSIVDIAITGGSSVTVEAEPPLGALATPAGSALPGIDLRVRVGGDPRRSVEVVDDTTDAVAHVASLGPTSIPAGRFVDVDLTVAPVDCARSIKSRDDGFGLLVTSEGRAVPLSDQARATLEAALGRACEQAGDSPTLIVTSARYGRPPALDSIRLTVDVDAEADRLVLTPLDTPGLRGLGSADRRDGAGIPLLWLLTPDDARGTPLAQVQVYVVRDGTAYPWVVDIPLTEDLPPWVPGVASGTLRDQAATLAEAAPRPGY